jgi:hypothetical protein
MGSEELGIDKDCLAAGQVARLACPTVFPALLGKPAVPRNVLNELK